LYGEIERVEPKLFSPVQVELRTKKRVMVQKHGNNIGGYVLM